MKCKKSPTREWAFWRVSRKVKSPDTRLWTPLSLPPHYQNLTQLKKLFRHLIKVRGPQKHLQKGILSNRKVFKWTKPTRNSLLFFFGLFLMSNVYESTFVGHRSVPNSCHDFWPDGHTTKRWQTFRIFICSSSWLAISFISHRGWRFIFPLWLSISFTSC